MDSQSFFGFELYNPQNYIEFLIRFVVNFIAIYFIAKLIYFKIRRNRDYLFTLFIFNIIVFFVCYLLNTVSLSIGFAFGIFAIFSILRYRTETILIKEMTYIFISISIAIINALGSNLIGILELVFANTFIIALVYGLEKIWVRNELSQIVRYEKIELVKPENHSKMIADLIDRTGLNIHRVEIGRIDFLRDTALLKVFYYDKKPKRL